MKIQLKQKFKGALTGYKTAFINAPTTLIICAVIGCLAIIYNHGRYFPAGVRNDIERIILTGILAIPFSMIIEKSIYICKISVLKQTFIRIIGFLILAIYYFLAFPDLGMKPITRLISFIILTTLIYIYISCLNPRDQPEKYTLYLIKRVVFAGIYALVIWGGISFTFFAFSELMDIRLWDNAYFDFLLVTLGFIIPAYFFSGIPQDTGLFERQDIQKFPDTLLSYILVPILTAYTAVLYIYFIRLLITFSWPEGMLGHLVIWYGLIGLIVMFFLYPIYPDKKITLLFYNYFPVFIIVPLIMMFISLGIRVKAYGMTEPRYWVIVIGIWVFLSTGFFVLSKTIKYSLKHVNKIIIILLAVICIISAVGPLSAYSVSIRSQNKRFLMLAERYDIFSETIDFNVEKMSSDDLYALRSIINYFNENHSEENLNTPKSFNYKSFKEKLNYNEYNKYRYITVSAETEHILQVTGYDYVMAMYAPNINIISGTGTNYNISVIDAKHIVMSDGENIVYTKDLSDYILELLRSGVITQSDEPKIYDKHMYTLPNDLLIFYDDGNIAQWKFFIQNAYCRIYDNEMIVDNISFYTAVKLK